MCSLDATCFSSTLPIHSIFFFLHATPPTEIYTLSLHDALPISASQVISITETPPDQMGLDIGPETIRRYSGIIRRSEEHTSELQSLRHLVCRLLLEKKKINENRIIALYSQHILTLYAYISITGS